MKSAKPTRTHARRKATAATRQNNLTPRQIKGHRLHALHKVKDAKRPAKCRRQQAFALAAQPSDNQRITKGHILGGKRCPFSLQFVSFRNIKGRKSEIRQRTTSQPSATSANRAYNNTCIKPRHCASQPSTAILSTSTARTPHLHYPTMYFYKKNKPAKTKGYTQSRRQQS